MAVPVTTCPHHPPPDHLRATTGSLQLSCHLSYIASWWHHPLSHPIPSQSFLTLAKYTLFLTTRWPPLSPLSPNHQYQKLWPTLFSPPFLILFPFLLLLFCNTHLALIAIRAFKSLQNFSQPFRKDIQFHIFLLYSFILQASHIFVTWLSPYVLPFTLCHSAVSLHQPWPSYLNIHSSKSLSFLWRPAAFVFACPLLSALSQQLSYACK